MTTATEAAVLDVQSVAPQVDQALLPGAQFVDAFRIVTTQPLNARQAAERMLTRSPAWVTLLMRLRNMLVAPFGLARPAPRRSADRNHLGIFPVVSETPQRLVAGFDDSHLDFRVVIDVTPDGTGTRVTASTLVHTHNLLGRTYLATIAPFHRLVVRSLLQQVSH